MKPLGIRKVLILFLNLIKLTKKEKFHLQKIIFLVYFSLIFERLPFSGSTYLIKFNLLCFQTPKILYVLPSFDLLSNRNINYVNVLTVTYGQRFLVLLLMRGLVW